jgi:RNA polymerase sigma-70 factor (ECF subfamily)
MGSTIEPMASSTDDSASRDALNLEDQLVTMFDAHYARMVRLAGLICHAGTSAEDAVQAAMEQAWRRRRTLRRSDSMRSWLDRIVVREAIRQNRRSWWMRLTSAVADTPGPIDPNPSIHTTPERLALAAALRALPVEQRAVCVLHLHAGYSVPETARLMGASVETTRSRLRLARRRLRAELSEVVP